MNKQEMYEAIMGELASLRHDVDTLNEQVGGGAEQNVRDSGHSVWDEFFPSDILPPVAMDHHATVLGFITCRTAGDDRHREIVPFLGWRDGTYDDPWSYGFRVVHRQRLGETYWTKFSPSHGHFLIVKRGSQTVPPFTIPEVADGTVLGMDTRGSGFPWNSDPVPVEFGSTVKLDLNGRGSTILPDLPAVGPDDEGRFVAWWHIKSGENRNNVYPIMVQDGRYYLMKWGTVATPGIAMEIVDGKAYEYGQEHPLRVVRAFDESVFPSS